MSYNKLYKYKLSQNITLKYEIKYKSLNNNKYVFRFK